jgi:hypothetical protein
MNCEDADIAEDAFKDTPNQDYDNDDDEDEDEDEDNNDLDWLNELFGK